MKISQQHQDILKKHVPYQREVEVKTRAAVSIMLRDSDNGSEFLMMQRAHDERDPWSGQMAFPGGKIDPTDKTVYDAAVRETQEEVAVQLHDADFIGQIDDCYGITVQGQYRVHVSCYIFKPTGQIQPTGNYEVADLVWVPLSVMASPERRYVLNHPADTSMNFPAVMLNEDKHQILWGLSLRMVLSLFELLELPISVFTEADMSWLKTQEKRGIKRGA